MDWSIVMEVFYTLTGLLLICGAVMVYNDKENKTRIGGSLFWGILGIIFITGNAFVKSGLSYVVGIMILLLGVLSATKQVNIGHLPIASNEFREEQAKKLGNKIFIPSLLIAVSAFYFAQVLPKLKLGITDGQAGQMAIGLSAFIGLIGVLYITKSKVSNVSVDGVRLIQQMGPSSILPQLLATLGFIFTSAGVGNLISGIMSGIIPDGNRIFGVIMYCLGMAIFTIIMGNAFAAFAVITTGIGIPFIIMNGGNPVIVGALGLTAGYCGTLLTPMAANFNIVPANLLETKSQYTVVKYQAPLALIFLGIHIVLMYFLAFKF